MQMINTIPTRLNIFYLTLEKVQGFASGKYGLLSTPNEVVSAYDARQSDARQQIDNLNINKRLVSTARMVQTQRGNSGESTLARPSSSPNAVTRAPSAASAFKKAPPPPPPSSSFASPAPPPYSAASSSSSVGAKRPPPPIPAAKPKPKPAPQYVVALYDFVAQVSIPTPRFNMIST